MTDIRRRVIDTEAEENICIGLIMSDRFCRAVVPSLRLDVFEGDYSRLVARWARDYYGRYKQAPGFNIQDIFNANKAGLKQEYAERIGEFLYKLSDRYSDDESKFNADYYVDQARMFIKKRSLSMISDNIRGYIAEDKVDRAEKEIEKYRDVAIETTQWVDPFDPDFVERVLLEEEEGLIAMPGCIGDLAGPMKRGWLVGFMAPRKRGKSWFLLELVVQAILTGLRVVLISLEMTESGFASRFIKRITSLADVEGNYLYPVFDCKWNQDDSCKLSKRAGSMGLLVDGQKPAYKDSARYIPCDACRRPIRSNTYRMEFWWADVFRERINYARTLRKMKPFNAMYGADKRVRMITYPPRTANIAKVRSDLDHLEYSEGFVPDVIALDYADILMPEEGGAITIETTGETWLMMKSIAAERYVLFATATQSTRQSATKRDVKHTDAAWDIRKIDHCDLMYALSQTAEEKRLGQLRASIVAHRWKEFDETKQVRILQNLRVGQPVLDSESILFEDMLDVLDK